MNIRGLIIRKREGIENIYFTTKDGVIYKNTL